MNYKCLTCGGECVLSARAGGTVTYKCSCCDNVYKMQAGTEESFFNPVKQIKKQAERAESTVKNQPVSERDKVDVKQVTPRNMPEITQQKAANGVLSGEEVYSRNIKNVIELRSVYGGTLYSGSGYITDSGGIAITNAHVVTNGGKIMPNIEAYCCGKKLPVKVLKLGSEMGGDDLALLKISGLPSDVKGVKFAKTEDVLNGQRLYVIGNSLGGGTCITSGIVSDRRRTVLGKPRLMTDCAVNKGNSGGPVFNDRGEVVGTIVAVTTAAEGMNYAVPSDVVIDFLAQCGIKILVN